MDDSRSPEIASVFSADFPVSAVSAQKLPFCREIFIIYLFSYMMKRIDCLIDFIIIEILALVVLITDIQQPQPAVFRKEYSHL